MDNYNMCVPMSVYDTRETDAECDVLKIQMSKVGLHITIAISICVY